MDQKNNGSSNNGSSNQQQKNSLDAKGKNSIICKLQLGDIVKAMEGIENKNPMSPNLENVMNEIADKLRSLEPS